MLSDMTDLYFALVHMMLEFSHRWRISYIILKAKAYQKRKVAFMENGTWAPTAAKQMKAIVESFKNIEMIEPVVTIKSTLNENSRAQMDELVQNLVK